jgi:hypothetical protein
LLNISQAQRKRNIMKGWERDMPPLSREEIASLSIRRYEGPVCVVASEKDLEQAIQAIKRDEVVGMDTETKPVFTKGQYNLPCLVQIAAADMVYLFKLKRKTFAGSLAKVLGSSALIKTGIGLKEDFTHLQKVFAFKPKNVIDLNPVAREHEIERSSVRNLAAQFLGFRITKGLATSNWASPELTPRQIKYAATDAWVCRELYLRFRELGLLDRKGIGDITLPVPKTEESEQGSKPAEKAKRPRRRRRKRRAGKKNSSQTQTDLKNE